MCTSTTRKEDFFNTLERFWNIVAGCEGRELPLLVSLGKLASLDSLLAYKIGLVALQLTQEEED